MTTDQAAAPAWKDPTRPRRGTRRTAAHRDDREEKPTQRGSRWVGNDPQHIGEHAQSDPEETLNVAPIQDVFAASGTVPSSIRLTGAARMVDPPPAPETPIEVDKVWCYR